MDLISYLEENLDNETYYRKRYPKWDGNHNTNVSCPFANKHDKKEDKRPSFSININGTGGAFCFACGTRIGSVIHHEKLIKKFAKDEDAATSIYSEFIHPILGDSDFLAPYKSDLSKRIREIIRNDLGISDGTIDNMQLGWDNYTKRVIIPIFDDFGNVINVRKYILPSMREEDSPLPKIINEKGFGGADIFGKPQLNLLQSSKHRAKVIYWMTGERDTLLAWDRGVPSFCITGSERTWDDKWIKYLKQLKTTIAIVKPNEKDGAIGAEKRFVNLQKAGISSFIIQIPEDKGKDFSDYVFNQGSVTEFLKIQHEQEYIPQEFQEERIHQIPGVYDPTEGENLGLHPVIDIGRNPKILNKKIQVNAVVSGRMDRTYSLPTRFKIAGNVYEIPICRELVSLVRCKDETIESTLRKWLKIKGSIEFLKYVTITEVEIIPMIIPGKESPFINQRCYYFGTAIESNKPYLMGVIPTTDCNTQETIGLIYELQPVFNVLEDYKLTEEAKTKFKTYFQSTSMSPQGILLDLKKLAGRVSKKHSLIYTRDDLHSVALLTWLSPLQFNFPVEGTQRGWINTLILGDTETGKSRVCQKLTNLFNCGVFISAENCSYVGLVGGVTKAANGMFMLRWGKIPLYNRQLVIIEEMSGLGTTEISRMSEVRSAGIARLDKGGVSGETDAKTRLICLSNVRGEGKSLSDYNSGVSAVQTLVGHNEDVSRFDLILTVTDDEVSNEIINEDKTTKEKEEFDSEELKAFKEFVTFIWSLKPDQIEFGNDAYRACLTETLKLCKTYHPSIPLFKAGSGRLKLARIACAIAASQFSWDDTKNKLVVKDRHVYAASLLLDKIYRKASLGYYLYSKVQWSLHRINNEAETKTALSKHLDRAELDFYTYISRCDTFTKTDVAEAIGIHFSFVEKAISAMFLANLIKKPSSSRPNEWQVTKLGRKWIEKQVEHK